MCQNILLCCYRLVLHASVFIIVLSSTVIVTTLCQALYLGFIMVLPAAEVRAPAAISQYLMPAARLQQAADVDQWDRWRDEHLTITRTLHCILHEQQRNISNDNNNGSRCAPETRSMIHKNMI